MTFLKYNMQNRKPVLKEVEINIKIKHPFACRTFRNEGVDKKQNLENKKYSLKLN